MIATVLLFLVGLAVLVGGAEFLVRGASRLARALGVPPVVIGLTVVAFGTSAPELVVAITAALHGAEGLDLALGNVVGSNLFNTGIILGASALVLPLKVERRIVRFDCPLMIGATLALIAFAWDGVITRVESLALLAGFGLAMWATFRGHEGLPPATEEPVAAEPKPTFGLDVLAVLLGLSGLMVGGHLIVTSAVSIARALGVSELMIGLTVVAAGTSLPELATSVVASVRKQPDIAVGNVIGSNVFNVLLILGTTGTIAPVPVKAGMFSFDLPVLVGFTLATWPIVGIGGSVGRARGGLLVLGYLLTLGVWIAQTRAP